MNYEYHSWYSERCGKEMGVLRIGHWGPALIYFPTCGGDHSEFERYVMQEDARAWIEAGKVQIFSVDAINHLTWYNPNLHPADKVRWAQGYEGYVIDEVLPLVHNITQNDFVGCFGASWGGYTVANFWAKHPDKFNLAVSMSGVYSIGSMLNGYYDTECYFNNPPHFLQDMSDPHYYDLYRNNSLLWMMCGENDICKKDNDEFSGLLNWKDIPHWYDVWPSPCDHHEYWWKKMLPVVLDKFYSW